MSRGDEQSLTPPASDAEGGPFQFLETKEGKVFITWGGKTVAVLRGKDAARFLERAGSANERERQQLMARITGNFKRGNERRGTLG